MGKSGPRDCTKRVSSIITTGGMFILLFCLAVTRCTRLQCSSHGNLAAKQAEEQQPSAGSAPRQLLAPYARKRPRICESEEVFARRGALAGRARFDRHSKAARGAVHGMRSADYGSAIRARGPRRAHCKVFLQKARAIAFASKAVKPLLEACNVHVGERVAQLPACMSLQPKVNIA